MGANKQNTGKIDYSQSPGWDADNTLFSDGTWRPIASLTKFTSAPYALQFPVTILQDIPDLMFNLLAGQRYKFAADLFCAAGAGSANFGFALGGTIASYTSLSYSFTGISNSIVTGAASVVRHNCESPAIGTQVIYLPQSIYGYSGSGGSTFSVKVSGVITVGTAGTLTIQANSSVGAFTILQGSNFSLIN